MELKCLLCIMIKHSTKESYEPLSVGCLLFPDEYRSIITIICEVHHVVALSHAER